MLKTLHMRSVQDIQKILTLAVASGSVVGARPISVLLVVPPEEGKTLILSQLRRLPGVAEFSLATAWGLENWLFKERVKLPAVNGNKPELVLRHKTLHHITMTDLNVPLLKDRASVMAFEGLLLKLLYDGVTRIETFRLSAIDLPEPVVIGMLAGITPDVLAKRAVRWAEMGLLRRWIPVSYSYSAADGEGLWDALWKLEDRHLCDIDAKLPEAPIEIAASHAALVALQPVAQNIARSAFTLVGEQGKQLRGLTFGEHLITLCQAHAILRGGRFVTPADVAEVRRLAQWMNYDKRPL